MLFDPYENGEGGSTPNEAEAHKNQTMKSIFDNKEEPETQTPMKAILDRDR